MRISGQTFKQIRKEDILPFALILQKAVTRDAIKDEIKKWSIDWPSLARIYLALELLGAKRVYAEIGEPFLIDSGEDVDKEEVYMSGYIYDEVYIPKKYLEGISGHINWGSLYYTEKLVAPKWFKFDGLI